MTMRSLVANEGNELVKLPVEVLTLLQSTYEKLWEITGSKDPPNDTTDSSTSPEAMEALFTTLTELTENCEEKVHEIDELATSVNEDAPFKAEHEAFVEAFQAFPHTVRDQLSAIGEIAKFSK